MSEASPATPAAGESGETDIPRKRAIGPVATVAIAAALIVGGFLFWLQAGLIYALALLIIYGVIWIILRFYYLEIKSNEVVYRHGLFGDVERHDTRGMKHTKEIGDLMEFALWRSGRLILAVQGRKEPHVLDNVPRINRVEHQIQQVTSRQSVEIET